ncbi:MAG: hypothetical protein J4F39_16910 [Candidatus Latescibacteria bacterium]|nr:hypothetical protein [Candidatus Latescibacterota bacterium]
MGLDKVQDPYVVDSPSAFSHHKEAVFNTPEATPVSNFAEEVRTPEMLDISFFDAVNYHSHGRSDDWKVTGLQNFACLVSNRISYLGGLRNLERDWVSGGAVKPSSSAIVLSQELLLYIEKKVLNEEFKLIPRIVMGPTPSGGVIVELHVHDDNAINVTIMNDDCVDLEVLNGGCNYELNLQGNELNGSVPSQYASMSR